MLCQSYSVSEDGLTWSFQLRSGVTFSDGTLLTAEEAATSLNSGPERTVPLCGPALRRPKRCRGRRGAVTVVLSAPQWGAARPAGYPPSSRAMGTPLWGPDPYVLEGEKPPAGHPVRLVAEQVPARRRHPLAEHQGGG
ncbi:MAG: ABC transporter substrate-binding protein [Intestinimonas sp.]